jgi:flavin-dependent dehydrogenase
MKEALVVGAGPSGLVAAINLAREGFKVRVYEREAQVGGYPYWHPSAHDTPVGKGLFNYIGIDLKECFQDCTANFLCVIQGQLMEDIPPMPPLYACERGARPTSLDSVLFKIAQKEGVDFEFNRKFLKEDMDKAPETTVLATGLSPEMYEICEVPTAVYGGYFGHKEITDPTPRASIFFGGFASEYGYSSCVNNIYYVLLFSRREVTDKNLDEFRKQVQKFDHVEFDKWNRFKGFTPKACNLLYKDRFILTGTLAGVVEPAIGFGITGALLGGKIAAITAVDREKGKAEYHRFTRLVPKEIERKRQPGYIALPPPLGDVWFDFPE